MRLVTVGVGAMNSPRYGPAGLLVAHEGARVMIDGGPGAEPPRVLDAWLVTDERAELISQIRRLAAARGLVPYAGSFRTDGLRIDARPVIHTNHRAYGYRVRAGGHTVVWAPEFYRFPAWARGADLMFADAAAWDRPIRFVGGVGGHADVLTVAEAARQRGVSRLVFAHIGRPTLQALSRGAKPPFGEVAVDGQVFVVGRRRAPGLRRRWVQTVTTASTFPQEGLFTQDAATIARALASRRVSPKGPTSGLRMLLFFINRAGSGLSRARRAELLRAKRILQRMIATRRPPR